MKIKFQIIILLLFYSLFFIGCSGFDFAKKSKADTASLNKLTKKSPLQVIKEIAIKRPKKPITYQIASQFSQNKFSLFDKKSFERLDPQTDKPKKIRTFKLQKLLKGNIKEHLSKKKVSLEESLFFMKSNNKFRHDLLLIDDTFSISPNQFDLFYPNLSQLVYSTNLKTLSRTNKRSIIESLINTSSKTKEFLNNSNFSYPLGHKKLKAFAPFAMNLYTVYYNSFAKQTLYSLSEFHLKLKKEQNIKPYPEFDEFDFKQFVTFLKTFQFKFYYPDIKSKDPIMKKHGITFLCQLLFWLEPSTYNKFLNQKTHPLTKKSFLKVKQFLKKNKKIFLKESSLSNLVSQAVSSNILTQLPNNFDPLNYNDNYKFPSEYDLDSIGQKLSFAYLPESQFVDQYNVEAYKEKNKEVLSQIKKKKIAEKKRKSKRKKKKKKKRSKKRKKKKKKSKKKKTKLKKPKIPKTKTSIYQLTGFILHKSIAIRTYLSLFQSSKKKKQSLFLINNFLLKSIQKKLSQKPNFLRPILNNVEPETYVKKITSANKKLAAKSNAFFTIESFIPQSDLNDRFVPMLNYYYQNAAKTVFLYK